MEEVDPGAAAHLYRGELSRAIAWRVRLDTTTNWAIAVSGLILTFALGARDVPHFVMLLALALDLQLLWLESRRYRSYELSRRRVQLLEQGFIAGMLGEGTAWRDALRASYLAPQWTVGTWDAISHRLRRNYLWIVAVVGAAWLIKLRMHGGPDLVTSAHIGLVPGAVVLGAMMLLFTALAVLAWRAPAEGPA